MAFTSLVDINSKSSKVTQNEKHLMSIALPLRQVEQDLKLASTLPQATNNPHNIPGNSPYPKNLEIPFQFFNAGVLQDKLLVYEVGADNGSNCGEGNECWQLKRTIYTDASKANIEKEITFKGLNGIQWCFDQSDDNATNDCVAKGVIQDVSETYGSSSKRMMISFTLPSMDGKSTFFKTTINLQNIPNNTEIGMTVIEE